MKEGVVEGGIEEICGKVFRSSGGELDLEGGRFISSRRRVRRSCTGGRCVCRSVMRIFGTAGSESR